MAGGDVYAGAASRKKFLRRLEVLQSASIEGKGPSQLKSFEETDSDQQHRTEGEIDPSSHTAVLSNTKIFIRTTTKRRCGEEHGTIQFAYQPDAFREHLAAGIEVICSELLDDRQLKPGKTGIVDSTYVAHEEIDRAEPQLGSDNDPHK
ncbi:hypothetical protein HO173_010771 [Letharia columbiana]|uniref:Uncharacterized protein n=1 Tax=Letharia columbiana TaxID=112416 RepID=A0A8H6FM55_9LECA|nr:uncharacterized protein HO173_010771 [Letharia columbiana]KAF6231071.1 hypothetical protein HO173_010771 [Letharia columbiana]